MQLTHSDPVSLAHDLAKPTYGLVSRHLLRTHGIDRHKLRRLAMQGALLPCGAHAVHVTSARWDPGRSPVIAAVINAGPSAWADGAAALVVSGLTGYGLESVDIGVPENAATRHIDGVRRHRMRTPPPLRPSPVLHAEVNHAALRAASWCGTDHTAASLLATCVEQHLTTVQELRGTVESLPTLRRRGFVVEVLDTLARSHPALHELDLPRWCRRRELPEPDDLDLIPDYRGSIALEARWREAGVLLRIEAEAYPLRVESYSDVCETPTIAHPGDLVLRGSYIDARRSPTVLLDRLKDVLGRTAPVQASL